MASVLCLILSVNHPYCVPDSQIEALGRTWAACAMVESGGDPYCRPGDGGQAVGILQIRPTMVEDVNRILGREEFTLADRSDVSRSVRMFVVYCLHYFPQGTPEQWARAWNGGPSGPSKNATQGYWSRVRAFLKFAS